MKEIVHQEPLLGRIFLAAQNILPTMAGILAPSLHDPVDPIEVRLRGHCLGET
jgi:hypothetical protein